jgi:ankyrin repeat protein
MQNGWTPVHWAADKGQDKVVEVLVQAGADVNAANKVRHFLIFVSPRCTVTVIDVQATALTLCRFALVITVR